MWRSSTHGGRAPLVVLALWAVLLPLSWIAPAEAQEDVARCPEDSIRAALGEIKSLHADDAPRGAGNPGIRSVQKWLRTVGYDPVEMDGVIGIHTRRATEEFCSDFFVDGVGFSGQALYRDLQFFSTIVQERADWNRISADPRFREWKRGLPAERRLPAGRVPTTGPALVIRSLLDFVQTEATIPAPQSPSLPPGAYFELTEQDLSELATREATLQELQAQTFPSKTELVHAVLEWVHGITDENRDVDRDTIESVWDKAVAAKKEAEKEHATAAPHAKEPSEVDSAAEPEEPTPAVPNSAVSPIEYTLFREFLEELNREGLLIVVPGPVSDMLQILEGVPFPSKALFLAALEQAKRRAAGEVARACEAVEPTIVRQARKFPDYGREDFRWRADSCGCLRDLSSIVYGFYAPWFFAPVADPEAGELPAILGLSQEVETLEIDFSVLTRIGVYALPLDARGDVLHDILPDVRQLDRAARHLTAVDLVAYTAPLEWLELDQDLFFQHAKSHILESLGLRASRPPRPAFAADGVTLFFEGFPTTDERSSDRLMRFLGDLRTELDKAPKRYFLNLVLRGNEIGEGVFRCRYLQRIIPSDGNPITDCPDPAEPAGIPRNVIDLFLVVLDPPTTTAKKELRSKIERELKGIQRRNLLRKVIPIIPPNGHERQPPEPFGQYADDLIYFEDNFRGVGFWPLPAGEDEVSTRTRELLVEVFGDATNPDFLEAVVKKHLPWLCRIICPNRLAFRISFGVLLGALLLYGLLSIWIIRLRIFFERRFAYFVVVSCGLVVLVLIGLACDPFWNEHSDEVAILMVIVGIAALGWYSVASMKRKQLP